MENIEFILDNFLGMSYENQIKVLEYLMDYLIDNKNIKLTIEFDNIFENYLIKLKTLLEFKKEYSLLNIDKRRLAKKIVLDKLKEIAINHRVFYSDEKIKENFAYSSEYYGEFKRYFNAKKISNEDVERFIDEFEKLPDSFKTEFIKDIIFGYKRINYLKLPYPELMLDEYNSIMESLLGEDVMPFYNKLFSKEKMELILKLVTEFRCFNNDKDYYNYKLNSIKEYSKIIKKAKSEAINHCFGWLS